MATGRISPVDRTQSSFIAGVLNRADGQSPRHCASDVTCCSKPVAFVVAAR
jgi:hypothetical protein